MLLFQEMVAVKIFKNHQAMSPCILVQRALQVFKFLTLCSVPIAELQEIASFSSFFQAEPPPLHCKQRACHVPSGPSHLAVSPLPSNRALCPQPGTAGQGWQAKTQIQGN